MQGVQFCFPARGGLSGWGWDDPFQSSCPSGAGDRLPARLGRLPGVGQRGSVMGLRPSLAPSALPPKHPLRGSSVSIVLRGHAARAAGASFPRCAHSGDLPPRRVNAIARFRVGQNPLQPNIQTGIEPWRLGADSSPPESQWSLPPANILSLTAELIKRVLGVVFLCTSGA